MVVKSKKKMLLDSTTLTNTLTWHALLTYLLTKVTLWQDKSEKEIETRWLDHNMTSHFAVDDVWKKVKSCYDQVNGSHNFSDLCCHRITIMFDPRLKEFSRNNKDLAGHEELTH